MFPSIIRFQSMRRHAPLLIPLLCSLLLPGAPAARAQDAGPAPETEPAAAIVTELHATLKDMMQNADTLGYAGRYARMEPVVAQRFDTPLIVKVILSRNWSGLGDDDKAAFIELFGQLSAATYAARFNSWSGQEFVETGREILNAGRVLIKTELQRPHDGPVKLDYLMHRNEAGEWRIISVIANGVNDLSLKRAEYGAVMKERGFGGLVEELRRKISDMEAGGGG